jgi:CBS-domain-containing membrane protein
VSHLGCAALGVAALAVFGPGWVARAVALAAAIAFMQYTGSLHPPGDLLTLYTHIKYDAFPLFVSGIKRASAFYVTVFVEFALHGRILERGLLHSHGCTVTYVHLSVKQPQACH